MATGSDRALVQAAGGGVVTLGAPAGAPSRRDRVVQRIATLAVLGVYRRVGVMHRVEDTGAGPRLVVANHFGGFADPLLLIAVLPRVPRIVARDVIWRVPLVGWVMRWLRAIPVHKPSDRGPGSNDQMFASAYTALEHGEQVMIFPEGITRDEPSIAPIKTGAARIVLGARAAGVAGIVVAPAGIHYEDKAAFRSDVSIQFGVPMDIDATIGEYVPAGTKASPDDRSAVTALTEDIERHLRRVAPDFTDWRQARTASQGAEILLRAVMDDPTHPVPLAARDRIAGRVARADPSRQQAALAAVDAYVRDLSGLGLTDAELHSGITGGRLLRRLAGNALLAAVLLPFALVGAAVNWLPYLVVRLVGWLPLAPAVLATIVPMTAIVAFGATWGVAIWGALTAAGMVGAALTVLLLPVYLAAVVVVTERLVGTWRAVRTWRRLRGSSWDDALTSRQRTAVDALVEAL